MGLKKAVSSSAKKIDEARAAEFIGGAAVRSSRDSAGDAAAQSGRAAKPRGNQPTEGFKRTSIDLPASMLYDVKRLALERQTTAAKLIRAWIMEGLERDGKDLD